MLDVIARLNGFISVCDTHISITKESIRQVDSIEERAKTCDTQIGILELILLHVKATIKIGKEYLSDKRDNSLFEVKRAIQQGASIINDCPAVKLRTHSNYAALVCGPKGRESLFNDVQGGGCRSSVAFLTRKAVLANTPYMPFILCDEAFPTMDPDTAKNFSLILHEIAKTMQIIVIEQHPDVTESGVSATYRFRLDENGRTNVTREDVSP